ncbi:MAG: hypothetical protein V3W34_05025 [Phycisphaerae bacterium]
MTFCTMHVPTLGCGSRRRGFTLTELATVSATVTVIAGLLLPALSEARRESKKDHCLANLARLAEASMVHATTDRTEMPIPAHPLMGMLHGAVGEYEWGGKSGIGAPLSVNDPTTSMWGTQFGRGPASRGLNRIVYGDVFADFLNDPGPGQSNWLNDTKLDLDVFHCPADYGYTGHHSTVWRDSGLTSFDHYGNSYVASTLWVGIPGADCEIMSNTPFLRPLSRIPNAANTLLFLENSGKFAWRKNYGADGCTFLAGGPLGGDVEVDIRGWHGRPWHFQVAFVDGHVATIRMEGHQQPQPRIGRYPDLLGFHTQYFNWHCVIIRGPGWQKDTLPAPPVRTQISCSGGGVLVNSIQ